jgi:hypothetical protein
MAGAAPENNFAVRTVLPGSPASTARTARRGTMGTVIVELPDTTTTLALPEAANADRHAVIKSTTPK